MPAGDFLLLLSDLYRRVVLGGPQALRITRCYDTQAKQNNQNPE